MDRQLNFSKIPEMYHRPDVVEWSLLTGNLRTHDIVHVEGGTYQLTRATPATSKPRFEGRVEATFYRETPDQRLELEPSRNFSGTQREFSAHVIPPPSKEAAERHGPLPTEKKPGTMALEFRIQGSAAEPYIVIFEKVAEMRIRATCTCPAGKMGQACKHRIGLINGDAPATAELAEMLSGTPLKLIIRDISKIEADMEELKKASAKLRKNAGRIMEAD